MDAQPERSTLAEILDGVAAGRFPPADGGVTIVPQPSKRDAGVIGFTAHSVIFTNADPAWVRAQLPPEDLSAPLSPPFLHALSAHTGLYVHTIDMVCVAAPLRGEPGITLAPEAASDHPRVARALRYRDDVRSWRTDGGVVTVGRGIARRWETSIEVNPGFRDKGLGRALALAARHLVPGDSPVWAQISPANAASVRAFLAAGFSPVGAEALLKPGQLGD